MVTIMVKKKKKKKKKNWEATFGLKNIVICGKMFEFWKKLYAYFFVHKNKQNSAGNLTSFGEINFFPKSGWPGLISFQHVHLKKEFQLNLSDLNSKFV